MHVKELIEKLQKESPESDVVLWVADMGYGGNKAYALDQIVFNQTTSVVELSATEFLC